MHSLSNQDGKWCVVGEDGEIEGTHDFRTDAIKQQRALYANESRVASIYAELDAIEEEVLETVAVAEKQASELVKIVVGNEQDKALTASVMQALEVVNARLQESERINEAMVAALQGMADMQRQPSVVNVEAPNVTMEPRFEIPAPIVNVEPAQITVTTPEVHVPAPQVTVNMPERSKTITFERDFDGRVTKADVVEGGEQSSRTT